MISNTYFDTPSEKGAIANIFFGNGYGASIEKNNQPDLEDPTKKYSIGFLIKRDYHTWSCELDDKLLTITQETEVYNLTEEEIDTYLNQIKVL